MPGEPQFEKDIAALRSHVIDGIEDLKNVAQGIDYSAARSARLLKWILVGILVIALLIAVHVLHHW
jgi:t-SNARE complex subunit (syntaxin)